MAAEDSKATSAAAATPDWRVAAAIFVIALCVVEWQNGNRFQLLLDEGIYLDGASRVARGQVPYRDFFTFTGPGSYWSYGALFALFGPSLTSAHFLLSVEIAIMSTAIYWLAAALTSSSFAAVLGMFFTTSCLDRIGALYITHRWDSNTWALVGLTFACVGFARPRRWYWIASGVCTAIAAWMTPPFVIVAALMALWMFSSGGPRCGTAYLAGMAAPCITAAGVLLYQGAFGPMMRQLLWAPSHYGAVNIVPYGYLVGNPLAGARGIFNLRTLEQFIRYIEYVLPALLPVISYLGLGALLFVRRKQLQQNRTILTLLVLFSAGVLAAGLPRMDSHQMVYFSPVFLILSGYVLYTATRDRRSLTGALIVPAVFMFVSSMRTNSQFAEIVETSAGQIRCTSQDAKVVSALAGRISPGDTLFVFPYMPIVYFLSGGENPTHYTFLQPGMMSGEDEAAAEAEVRAHPPEWMLWAKFPPHFWLETWPHSNPRNLDFPRLEKYMTENYNELLRFNMLSEEALILGCAKNCVIGPTRVD